MFGLFVPRQVISLGHFVFTLVTFIPHSFMLDLYMCLNIPILGAFVFALVTLIPPAQLLTAALREAAGHTNTFMPNTLATALLLPLMPAQSAQGRCSFGPH
jgi:hypothetical protein